MFVREFKHIKLEYLLTSVNWEVMAMVRVKMLLKVTESIFTFKRFNGTHFCPHVLTLIKKNDFSKTSSCSINIRQYYYYIMLLFLLLAHLLEFIFEDQ